MIRVGVIGIGSMGKNHVRVYGDLPEVELVAIADINVDKAKLVGERYRVSAYKNYQDMLSEEQLDAVSVVVPTASHEEVATDVLKSGVHVLLEKPIASTVEEGLRIIEVSRQVDKKLMIGHIVRFNPALQVLKAKLENGDLGRIFQITCRRVGPFPERIRDVGVVIDLAPHDLDIMRYLTGLEPLRLFAETERRIHTEHEDMLFGLLRFPEGITASIEINWLTPTKVREVLVLGERGLFRVDDLTQDLYFYKNALIEESPWRAIQMLKGVSEGEMIRYAIQRCEPLKAEIQSFIQAIINDKQVPVPGDDGIVAIRLARALVESGRKNQVINLNL